MITVNFKIGEDLLFYYCPGKRTVTPTSLSFPICTNEAGPAGHFSPSVAAEIGGPCSLKQSWSCCLGHTAGIAPVHLQGAGGEVGAADA